VAKEFLDLWSKRHWCWIDFTCGCAGCLTAVAFLWSWYCFQIKSLKRSGGTRSEESAFPTQWITEGIRQLIACEKLLLSAHILPKRPDHRPDYSRSDHLAAVCAAKSVAKHLPGSMCLWWLS